MSRTYINVSYLQRHRAKTFGAKWDPEQKKWYIPQDIDAKNKKKLIDEYGVVEAEPKTTNDLEEPLKPAKKRRRRFT